MKRHNIRLVVARAIYNEEQFIFDSLMSQRKILDIDATYIADGSWNPDDKAPNSTDGTRTITKLFPNIKWKACLKHYDSEADKRNKLITWIEQEADDEHTWVLVLDGDEEILFRDQVYKDQFLESDKTIRLKPILEKLDNDCDFVILESFPHNDEINHPLEYFQLRLFKAGKGITWDKDFPMRYIDKDGNILMDYSEDYRILAKKHHYIKNLVIRNKWFERDPIRILKTQEYLGKRRQKAYVKDRTENEASGNNIFF